MVENIEADVRCGWCWNLLKDEELESPHHDSAGHVICDDCYHDHYEFTCCWCQEYGHVDDQHNMLVIAEPVPADGRERKLSRGVYRIVELPYYGGPLIGEMRVYNESLKMICPLPEDIDTNGFPCGHLCIYCQRKIEETLSK